MQDISIYIHIPFCKTKCSYCSFCVIPKGKFNNKWKDNYTYSIIQEIKKNKLFLMSKKIKTIYLGGGTPSELGWENIKKLVVFLQNNFDLSKLEEFNIEINPDLDDDIILFIQNLQSIIKSKLRFSFGVQSLDNKVLKFAGRNYDKKYIYDFLDKIKEIKQDNNIYNLDFISFGIEDISMMDEFMLKYNSCIDSFSIYTLELFPGSGWHDIYKSNDDKVMDKFSIYCKLAKKYGYYRYEISNFAKKGKESIHNQGYWNGGEYIGFGISASSFVNKTRYTNANNIQDYFEGRLQLAEKLQLSKKDLDIERIFLGFRTNKGADYNLVKIYGDREKLQEYINNEYLEIKGRDIVFTDKGFDIYNYIITDLLDFD